MTTYSTGTASVEAGENLVTISGLSLEGVLFAGDLFAVPGQPLVPPQRIAANPIGNTFVLWEGWPGATLSGAPYEVRFAGDGVRTAANTRRYLDLLGQLSALGLQPNAFGELADRADYDDEATGFIFLAIGDPWTLYIKLSATTADWDDGQTMEGAPGAPGARGWSPAYAVAVDGARRVKQLVGYVGGEGTAPTAGVGQYVGPAGYVTDIAEATDIRGPAGIATDGDDGADGTDPGVLLTWNDDTADANPGGGGISADNADLSAATMLFVSKTNRAGNNIASWLLGLASSTSTIKGQLTLTRSGGNAQVLFNFSAVTDATGYVKLSVSGHSGATALVDGNALSLQVSKTGNAGEGDGDVVGPASAVNNRLAAFDGTTGKLLKDGGVAVSDFATAAQGAKVDYLTVTQPVDLDAMETRVNALDAAVVLMGGWDASAGTFPGGDTAQAGASYIVTVAGTVGGIAFSVNDRVLAITDNASTTTYAANWLKLDYTDQVLSVDGTTGAVTVGAIIAAATGKTTPVDADSVALSDSEASNATKKLTWANLKATLKTYFDSLTTKLTNKRIQARVNTITSSATPTVNTDNTDVVDITALAAAITSMTTNLAGTPDIGDVLIYQIKDNGTARAITWGASFAAAGVALPTTTVISKRLTVGFMWNGTNWGCVGSAQEA